MIFFLFNLLLAIAWVTVTGSASLHNLVLGLLLGALALVIIRESFGGKEYIIPRFRPVRPSRSWLLFPTLRDRLLHQPVDQQ